MDVVRVQWPAEVDRRLALRRQGVPRLLLVAEGEAPPDDIDVLEDWSRAGAAEQDIAARELTLVLRAARVPPPPHFDDDGLLRYGRSFVALSPLETRVATVLIDRLGHLVDSDTLARAGWPDGAPTPATMTMAMRRLRDRLHHAGLVLTVISSRGWMLDRRPAAG
jgi:DNA-binding response OmpR family regulator